MLSERFKLFERPSMLSKIFKSFCLNQCTFPTQYKHILPEINALYEFKVIKIFAVNSYCVISLCSVNLYRAYDQQTVTSLIICIIIMNLQSSSSMLLLDDD